jgi:type II restriction enzyme
MTDGSNLTTAQLEAIRASLTLEELGQLLPTIAAVRTPASYTPGDADEITTPKFVDRFTWGLKMFHASHHATAVLNKKAFEFLFDAASVAAGRDSRLTPNPSFPGRDVTVDGTRFSLKTATLQGLEDRPIKISKFMELKAMRSFRTRVGFFEGRKYVLAHLEKYDRILMLRVFGSLAATGEVRYELREIDCSLLAKLEHVTEADFVNPTQDKDDADRIESISCRVGDAHHPDFRVRFDGSVEKVTIDSLRTEMSPLHGSWVIRPSASLLV